MLCISFSLLFDFYSEIDINSCSIDYYNLIHGRFFINFNSAGQLVSWSAGQLVSWSAGQLVSWYAG